MPTRRPERSGLTGTKAGTVPESLNRRRRRECVAAALFVFLLAIVLFASGGFEPVENRLSEVRARLVDRPPSGQVAIVEIDAKSLAAIDTWPWSRRYHAELLNRLQAAGVSMVAFDVDFSARSDAQGDTALARALSKVHPVILPIFQQPASAGSDAPLIIKSRPAAQFRTAWVGGVNILPGRDGVVRDFPAATMIDGQIQPSMAVLLSDNGALGDRTFIPDWSINVRRIPRFSFVDVLSGRVGAKDLAGKRVMVGATAIEMGDRYAVPRFGTVPGVVIQALAAESLIQHRALARSGALPTILGLFLIVTLLAGRFERYGAALPLAAGGVMGALLIVPVVVQSRWPLSIDTAPLLLALIGGGLLRAVVEVRHRTRLARIVDAETGLANERALAMALDEAADANLCVTSAAIERFEAIRNTIGSAAAADLITQASAIVEQAVGSPVYRVAPDTIAWLIPASTDPEPLCASVSEQLAEPVVTEKGPVDVRCTYGLAKLEAASSPVHAIEQSLAAIAEARNEGVSRQWFRGMAPQALRDLSLMGELRRAMAEFQLFTTYQPKLNLRSGKISHAEALIRWRHPTEGLVPPDRFIPLAEETGVVRELTQFVLRRVIADCLSLQEQTASIGISVNVSAADVGQPDFARSVLRLLSEAGIAPSRLTLEITESAIIRSPDTALNVLHELRRAGVRLSIDDYGTGQSTLSYLKTLPVNELKIDKSFVTGMCGNENDRIMVRSTIDLAHQLDLTVVAEGVEDWDTARLLTELGCDYAQGFVIGRGVSIEELSAMTSTSVRKAA